jgi:predicted nucleic acid-binding protein
MKPAFIDTNIFIYASGEPHPHKNPSKYLLEKIALNRLEAITNTEVLQEILHRYWVIGKPKLGAAIFDDCIKIVPIILPINKQDILKARDLLKQYIMIEPRDAVHVAMMLNYGIKTLYSYDRHFDPIKGIKRIRP